MENNKGNRADIIVIGSGFGGAIPASKLAQVGFKVKVLERGPWRDSIPVRSMGIKNPAPFPSGFRFLTHLIRTVRNPRFKSGKVTLNQAGFYDLYLSKNLNIICASCVGGGSHAYGGVNCRPANPDYWDKIGIDSQVMEGHYQEVMTAMGALSGPPPNPKHPIKQLFADSPNFSHPGGVTEFQMGLLHPENPEKPAKIETDGIQRYESQPGCDGVLGSFTGGKTTLDFVYLHRAIKQHGLEVKDLHEVRLIRPGKDNEPGRYCVAAFDLRRGSMQQYFSDYVFVAAGTLNTLEILLRSRGAKSGLAGMTQLGKNFSANADLLAYWGSLGLKENIPASPTLAKLNIKSNPEADKLQQWPLVMLGLPGSFGLPLKSLVNRLFGRGLFVAGMGDDDSIGSIELQNDKLVVNYHQANTSIYARIRKAFKLMENDRGGKIHYTPRLITAHPLGGACIGRTASEGVISLEGEVFGHAGLYVTDGAALPTAVGAPPSMTIGAWSSYVADTFIAKNRAPRNTGI